MENLSIAQAKAYAAADGDWHIDAALTDVSIQYVLDQAKYIAPQIMPTVPVVHRSDKYFIWNSPDWFRIPQTLRAPGAAPSVVEATVSSAGYYAANYMLAAKIPYEDLANADAALDLEASMTRFVTQLLQLDQENRVATLLTTAANVGSGATLSGTAQWSDRTGSDPISDVATGKQFIALQTGMEANTMVVGKPVHDALVQHPDILDRIKYVQRATQATVEGALADIFDVERYLIGRAIKNTGGEGLDASQAFIWGKTVTLLHVPAAPGRNVPSAGYMFRWRPAGFQDFSVEVMDNETLKARFVRIGYFQDERITGTNLAYLLSSAVG